MAVQFDKLKQVDQRTRDLVTGFIRMMGIELDTDCIIPSLVVTLCILFYHLGEIFTVYGDHMVTDDTATSLSINELEHATAYGNVLINNKYKCIYRWDIKISHFTSSADDIFIGIDASNKFFDDLAFYYRYQTLYAFSQSGLKISCEECKVFKPFGKAMKEGDIVRMEINTDERTMRVYVNGEDMGIAYENILFEDKQYYLAISLCSNSLCAAFAVDLLDFEIIQID